IDQVSRLFAREATEERLRQARAGQAVEGWAAIEAAGVALALVPEADGGLGLDVMTVLAIARAHGRAGAPWPLAEAVAPPGQAPWGAALTVAEIAGLCETVLAMTLEWTQTRQQFGKPLSKNQAVQHSLAQMAAETAAAGAAVGLAGLGLIGGRLAPVAAAKARASEAAGIVAALAHQLHGAIGVTADHRLHLFTRALWQKRDAHGGEHALHSSLGANLLAGGSLWHFVTDEPLLDSSDTASTGDRFRFPVVAETAERAALRGEVRAFLAEELAALPAHVRAHSWNGHSPDFSRTLGQRGWLGMTWPQALGGHEKSALDRLVVIEELLAAGAPVAAHWIADRQTGPLLLKFGTPAQQQAYLPAIARGELYACIGMSEPGAGSDLAALTTRATPVEGGWRVNGTKLWTTYAHKAHTMLLLCRTGDGQRHEGLSQLLVPMDSAGLTVRPIIDLMGEHHFNEVHFDDVFVAHDALVGAEGNGWAQVMSELAYERSGPERFLSTLVLAEELVAALPADAVAAHAPIGRLAAHLMVLRLMARGMATLLEAGDDPALEAAMVKDLGATFEQAIPDVARSLLPLIPDPPASLLATLHATVQIAPMVSLRGGTREILRGIIARGLGVR
ncbi:acyl-CoA dehydrogenase family protein, partial [Sandarakinorhabdus sp.]|uniref:acyl-CoA dehydrogenase family protein n=1 Tax=Sandarakinorhabdus sp. TaxID=1916663 RepID=UPI00286D89F3